MGYIYLLGNFVQLSDLNILKRPDQLPLLHCGFKFLAPKKLKKKKFHKYKTERQTFCLIIHILIQKFEGTWHKFVSAVVVHIKIPHFPITILK